MRINFLKLQHFKNYSQEKIVFDNGVILLVGKNGNGKTNLIEAIYLLSLLKSVRSLPDQLLAEIGSDFYFLNGVYENERDKFSVQVSWKKGGRKQVQVDDKVVGKFSLHIGRFPVVLLSPDDSHNLLETSEERRRMVDEVLCQLLPEYLSRLQQYQHVLQQRNAFLKNLEDREGLNQVLLDTYNSQLLVEMPFISQKRIWFLEQLQPIFLSIYRELSGDQEVVGLDYHTDFDGNLTHERYYESQAKDLVLGRTAYGIHKDDFLFKIDEQLLKKMGSQGQIKTFLISLKLAITKVMTHFQKEAPILLLDDIFDKLDDSRIKALIQFLGKTSGQIFITDARPERSMALFLACNIPFQLVKIDEGKFV